jgi:hypothetical protein
MKVTLEMVRLANIVPGIFRKALQDIEFKGIVLQARYTYDVYEQTCSLT